MLRIMIAVTLCACIAILSSCGSTQTSQFSTTDRALSAVDATNAWNSVCATYHFIPKPANSTTTFAQGYYGRAYLIDITAITTAVNAITLGIEVPSGGNDVMKTKIENWGLVGGGL